MNAQDQFNAVERQIELSEQLGMAKQAQFELGKQVVELKTTIKEAHRQLCLGVDKRETAYILAARATLSDALEN